MNRFDIAPRASPAAVRRARRWSFGACALAVCLLWGCGAGTAARTDQSAPEEPRDSVRKLPAPLAEPEQPPPPPLPAALQPPAPAAKVAKANLPSAKQLAGAWARVYLLSNPGPYQYVAYEVTSRGGAGVVSHLRGVMGRRDAIIRTELISAERLAGLMATLRDLGAADLPDPGPLPGMKPRRGKTSKTNAPPAEAGGLRLRQDVPHESAVPIYELSYRLAGKERTVLIAEPTLHADPRFSRFIAEVRRFVFDAAGEIGYHGPTGPDSRRGFLFIDSVPGATVTVDGVRLPEPTPVFAYAVSAGKHIVELENKEHGLKQRYKVTVKPGMTTSVEVDLR